MEFHLCIYINTELILQNETIQDIVQQDLWKQYIKAHTPVLTEYYSNVVVLHTIITMVVQ